MRSLLFFFVLFFGVTFYVAAEEIVIDFAHPKFAKLDAEGKKLLSEYARVYPKIKNSYENIRIDVTIKVIDNLSEQSLQVLRLIGERQGLNAIELKELIERSAQSETQYEIRHRLSDKYTRVDKKVNHPVTPSIRDKLPSELSQQDFIQEAEVALFTPTMGYQLSKNDPRQQYFSLNVKRDIRKPNAEDIAIAVMYFDTAPFSSDNVSLEEILFQSPPLVAGKPYPIVEYVWQKEIEGKQIVEIKLVSSRYHDSNPDDIAGIIRLYMDSWVIEETYNKTQIVSPGKYYGKIGWIRTSCTYDGIVDGVPLLKTYQRSVGDYDKDTQEEKLTRQMLCEVTNLVPGPPDLSEFDVAQFLPPGVRIGEVTPAGLSTVRIVAIVIGILLVIFGIYMKIRIALRERRNKKT